MEPHAAVAGWDGDHLTVHDSTQGPPRVQAELAKLFGLEPGQVRVLAEHVGRRLRLEGRAARARAAGGPGGPRRRPAREVRPDAPADVHGLGLPHAHDPEGPARRRGGRAARRARPRRVGADLDRQGVRRADGGGDPPHVRGAAPAHDASAGPPRRAHAGLDAGARRVPRHVRPRVGRRRAGRRARRRPRGAAPAQRTAERAGDGRGVVEPPPGRVPAPRCRALRLGRPRARCRGPARRALARRLGRGRVDLPGPGPAVAGAGGPLGARPLRGRHRRHRHRDGRPHGAAPGGGRRARRAGRPGRPPHRRQRPASRHDRRRLHGPGVVVLGRRARLPRAAGAPGRPPRRTTADRRGGGRRRHGRRGGRPPQAGALLLRRPVRRGPRRRRHRRGPGAAAARRLRGGPHRQPPHGPLAVRGRHDHGPVDGAARGERRRPGVRRLREPRPRRLPRGRPRRRRRRRGHLDRRGRRPRTPGRQGDRGDRHRRDGRRGRQRRLPRDGRARPRPADPPRPVAGRAVRGRASVDGRVRP